MTTSFSTLKKSSADLSRLNKEIEKINAPSEKQGDPRFWYPERDKSGNGLAVIRFLPGPAVDGEDPLPWVRMFSHGFKGPGGKWYIENSLTTLNNQKDPVSEYNSKLWNESADDNSPQRKQARAQKRKLNYISNILVISDPKNPENEGKVFLFRYGKKIFDKITQLMNPEFEGDPKVNPFDLWKGANFKLRIRMLDGYPNYDMSTFESPSPLDKDDKKLEEIWNKEYSLKELVAPNNFKSYDELKTRLNDVLELNEARVSRPSTPRTVVSDDQPGDIGDASFDEEDDDLKQFRALADD